MKRLFYLMLVVLGTAAFTACSDDDDNNGDGNNNGEGVITVKIEDEIEFLWIGTSALGEVITVNWGDGTTENFVSAINDDEELYSDFVADLEHEYTEKGTHTITITGKNIIEFGWEALTSMSTFTNAIYSIDASKCTTLESLYCYNSGDDNGLIELNLNGCSALKSLEIEGDLTSLDISDCTALTYLNCYDNQLTSLDVTQNTALTELDCGGNELTSLDVSKNTALTSLSCSDNQLTSLDVTKNTALTSLGCSGNQLTSLDVTKNTALTELDCFINQLTSLNVSGCTALTRLYCYDNQFTAEEMNKIYEALPTVESGDLHCDQLGNPGIAEQKGWNVIRY